jgi:hypothetical protein
MLYMVKNFVSLLSGYASYINILKDEVIGWRDSITPGKFAKSKRQTW